MTPQNLPKLTLTDIACEIAKRDGGFKTFAQAVKPEYVFCDFNRKIFSALSKFLEQVQRGERPILIIQAPPQHGKSDIVSRLFPPWVLGKYPNIKIAACSYSADLATSMNRDVQRIMTDTAYKKIFPNTRINERRVVSVDNMPLRNSERFDIIGKKGYYICAGVGGPLTGKSVDIGIIDDPIKNMQEARSEAVGAFLKEWYGAVFLTRLSKNSGQIIMATRWALNDFIGYLLDKYPAERISVMKFPAIDENGQALFPARQPLEMLKEVKDILPPHEWEALYQQNPTVAGGNKFKFEMFEKVSLPSEFDFTFSTCDTATKDGQENDFTVFSDWGVKDAQLYLITVYREKINASYIEAALRPRLQRAATYWGYRKAWIEPKMHGIYLNQKFFDEGLPVPSEADLKEFFKDRKYSKTERAENALSRLGNKKIYINKDIAIKDDLITEALNFPQGAHDDWVDTLVDAIKKAFEVDDAPKVFWI